MIPKTVQMDLVVYNLLNTAARTLGLHRRQVCLFTLSTSMAPSTDHSPLHNNNMLKYGNSDYYFSNANSRHFQWSYVPRCLSKKVPQLDALSDGKGITALASAVF